MYTREELGTHFGPYQVQIADYNLSLKDGTLIATRFWFPGTKLPFETKWDLYCQESTKNNETLEVITFLFPTYFYLSSRSIRVARYSSTNKPNFQETFPTVMEYLPYCKGSYTRERDHLRHPWMASQGFVIVR